MTIQSNNNQRVKKYYVYGHYTLDDKLFYIGVGTILNNSQKLKSKYSRAYHFKNRTKFWSHIKNKHGVIVKIIAEFYVKQESLVEEKRLITLYKRRKDGGYLCNLSDGGEIGPIGHNKSMTEEQKLKLSNIKSFILYIYDSNGIFLRSIKTIKETAKFCNVTYNAIHSCMKTKNYSNGFFIFKNYKGEKLNYSKNDLIFKSILSKKVVTENITTYEKILHKSIYDCCKYLKTDRKNLKKAIKDKRLCKEHKIYFEGQSAAKILDNKI